MKSHLRDCQKIWRSIYYDACATCVAEVSPLDLKTIESRVKDEGISFLTITLPNFARDFERSLELGYVDSSFFRNFRKNKAIPAFLQGMLSRIFDRDTGRINDVEISNSPVATAQLVACVRQVCLTFKKIELPCSPEREYRALENFIAIERSLELFQVSRRDTEIFDSVCLLLWSNLLRHIRVDELLPRHGPGATADRRSGNQKYDWQFWQDRLEPYFPFIDSCYPISSGELHHDRRFEHVSILSSNDEIPVKVTPVPKTLKGPRIIAIEPTCMQYAQQGIRDALYSAIESYWLTRGHVNFRDQTVNQSLAINASDTGNMATIDLSDASDRVPLSLSIRMFESNPDLRDAILSCRSTHAKMPDGRIIGPLSKFASMGSALCFPVEAMYFYTICVIATLEHHNLPVRKKHVIRACSDIYVYGDDIIVPTDIATSVLNCLARYNCQANTSKTFIRGFFRESCGVDAYLGTQVQPVYVGTLLPENRQQSSEIISTVECAKRLFNRGFLGSSDLLFRMVERVTGPLPTITSDSPVIGRNHFFHPSSRFRKRWNKRYQRLEVRCMVPSPVYRTDPLEGYGALQKSLMRLNGLNRSESYKTRSPKSIDPIIDYIDSIVSVDVKHLERSARHGVVAIKRRWVPVTLTGYSR